MSITPIIGSSVKGKKIQDILNRHSASANLKKNISKVELQEILSEIDKKSNSIFQEIGFVCKEDKLWDAFNNSYNHVKVKGGKIFTLPQVADIRSKVNEFDKAIGTFWFNPYSFEVYGTDESGKDIYQVQHGCGNLSTPEGFKFALTSLKGNGIMHVYLIKKGMGIDVFNVDDARNNKVDINKSLAIQNDNPFKVISIKTKKNEVLKMKEDYNTAFESGSDLNEEQFRELDDLVLQRYGSQEVLDIEAQRLFGKDKLNYDNVSSYHLLGKGVKGGRWLCVNDDDNGVGGDDPSNVGCFFGR